jgi:hypothetical protein
VTSLTDDHLARLVSRVTETMTGISFSASSARTIDAALLSHTALLTIGEGILTVGLGSDENGCSKLGSALFCCAAASVDASMRDDSLRELVNMTAGQIKRALVLDWALGLPKVFAGGAIPDAEALRKVRLQSSGVEMVLLLSELKPTMERRK